jgi:hypothetical protein
VSVTVASLNPRTSIRSNSACARRARPCSPCASCHIVARLRRACRTSLGPGREAPSYGLYSSADPERSSPPATRTWPLGSKVAVCLRRALDIDPVELNEPLAGSYSCPPTPGNRCRPLRRIEPGALGDTTPGPPTMPLQRPAHRPARSRRSVGKRGRHSSRPDHLGASIRVHRCGTPMA